MAQKKTNTTNILAMAFIFVALIVGAFFVSQQGRGGIFDLRNRASGPGGVSTITLQPTPSGTHYVGDQFPVDLFFAANGKHISAIALRLIYQDAGIISVVDRDPTQGGTQIESFATLLDPTFATSVNLSQRQPTGQTYIDYATTTNLIDGYLNASSQKLATITFQALKAGSVTIEHDPARSIITEKVTTSSTSGTLDVLQTILPYTITVAADTQAPVASISGDFGQTTTSATGSSVTFTWTGSDLPARGAGVTVPLTYSYRFDGDAFSAYTSATTITRVLKNGSHTFEVRAKDPSGNVSTPTSPGSKRTFTLNLAPFIVSRTPVSGTVGTQVTLTGYNFGATRGNSKVKFGTKEAASSDYVSWSDTQVVVKVPSGANGNITVTVDGKVSNSIDFSLGTMLKVVFNYEGITSDKGMKLVNISVRKASVATPQRFTSIEATWSAADSAYAATVGPLTAPFETGSSYVVSLLGPSRLRKTFTSITLTANATNIVKRTAATDKLAIADFNNDNKLTIEDIGLILSKFTAISVAATGDLAPFDLNSDALLDTVDIGLVLSKYTRLETPGDSE